MPSQSLDGGPVPGAVVALETSTEVLGVAVLAMDRVVYELSMMKPRAHSTSLLPACIEAIERSEIKCPDHVMGIAVTAGPGSFTGLRIGCATAQGLATAWQKPVALVSSFHAIMHQLRYLPNIAIVQGRARAQTVTAFYEACDPGTYGMPVNWDLLDQGSFWKCYGFRESIPMAARDMEDFALQLVCSGHKSIYVAGDAASEFCTLAYSGCTGRLLPDLVAVDFDLRYPRAGTVAVIGAKMLEKGLSVEPARVVPKYVRLSQAEARSRS